ncbi:zinc finger domain-containing protein [Sphaerisporangium flaviroseum]|uniref:zinc finger domain-containing protein n=1 Tax=Sphaerisporangium flaviroseum TaxID=509199 RepID=UPI0031EE611C
MKRLQAQVQVTVAEVHGVKCPRCLTSPGKPCRDGSGAEIIEGHGARWGAARRAAARYAAQQKASGEGGGRRGGRGGDPPAAAREPASQVAVGRRDPVNAAFSALREGQRQGASLMSRNGR